jgi:hypothetical protein
VPDPPVAPVMPVYVALIGICPIVTVVVILRFPLKIYLVNYTSDLTNMQEKRLPK